MHITSASLLTLLEVLPPPQLVVPSQYQPAAICLSQHDFRYSSLPHRSIGLATTPCQVDSRLCFHLHSQGSLLGWPLFDGSVIFEVTMLVFLTWGIIDHLSSASLNILLLITQLLAGFERILTPLRLSLPLPIQQLLQPLR